MRAGQQARGALCALGAMVLASVVGGCLSDPFRGSEVVLELGTQNPGDMASHSGQHYEVFAEINQGLVSVGRFTVDTRLDALSWPDGEKIGVATRIPAEGLPQSGIFFTTPANLADATRILISLEPEEDPAPGPDGPIVGRALLQQGQRSVLVGFVEGAVPTLVGGTAPLVDSRVAVILNEDEAQ